MGENRKEIEQGVMAGICLGGLPWYDKAAALGITEESFATGQARLAFRAAAGLAAHGGKIDALTIRTAAKDAVTFQELMSWCHTGLPTHHFDYHVDLLIDAALRDRLNAALLLSQQDAADESLSSEFARAQIEARISALSIAGLGSGEKSLAKIVDEQMAFFDKAYAQGCAGLRTGFDWWDDIGGLMPGSLSYISGPPGSFKTTLCRQIIEYICGVSGLRVDFASLEQTAGQIVGAMACRLAGASLTKVLSGRDSDALGRVKERAQNVVKAWPLRIVDAPMNTTAIWSWARRAVSGGSVLLCLDYLQCVTSSQRQPNEEQRVAEVSAALREIAKGLNVPVLALSSESRLGDMRHSMQVEFDCFTWVRTKKNDDGSVAVCVRKNRFGKTIPEFAMYYNRGALSLQQSGASYDN